MSAWKTVTSGLGAAGAGVVSAACCLGPILLSFGFGGAGFFSWAVPYRPYFIGLAVVFLGYGFFRTYRMKDCCPPAQLRAQKVILWVASIVTLLGVLSPYLLGLFV